MFTLNRPTKNADHTGYICESKPCPSCGTTLLIEVTPEQLFAYNQGGYVQDVLKDHAPFIRERFVTGFCGTCWDNMFSFDED